MTSRKQTAQGACFRNEQRLNSQEHKDSSGWQRRKIQLLWLMWPSIQCIVSLERVVDVISEACLTTRTGDRQDEVAVMDLSMIAVALTPLWLFWILIAMSFWRYFSSFLFFSVLFLNRNYISHTSDSCIWFLLPHVSLQPNWAWKPSKLGQSISFPLWGISSLFIL